MFLGVVWYSKKIMDFGVLIGSLHPGPNCYMTLGHWLPSLSFLRLLKGKAWHRV